MLALVTAPFAALVLLVSTLPPGTIWRESGFAYDVLEYHLQVPKEYFLAGAVTYLAVGCPVCNKVVLVALGTSGALSWFAPVQPLLGLAAVVRPNFPTAEKYIAYESGVDPVGMGWSQSQIRYYVFALLFVIFDVEAVFLAPGGFTGLDRGARAFDTESVTTGADPVLASKRISQGLVLVPNPVTANEVVPSALSASAIPISGRSRLRCTSLLRAFSGEI